MKASTRRLASVVSQRSLKSSVKPKKLGREVAAYLLSEKRTDQLDSIMRDVQQQRAELGVVEVLAISKHPLNETIRRQIRAELKKLYPALKATIIDEQIDSNLVGGVRLQLANQQLDLSLRTKLDHFRQLTTGKA